MRGHRHLLASHQIMAVLDESPIPTFLAGPREPQLVPSSALTSFSMFSASVPAFRGAVVSISARSFSPGKSTRACAPWQPLQQAFAARKASPLTLSYLHDCLTPGLDHVPSSLAVDLFNVVDIAAKPAVVSVLSSSETQHSECRTQWSAPGRQGLHNNPPRAFSQPRRFQSTQEVVMSPPTSFVVTFAGSRSCACGRGQSRA